MSDFLFEVETCKKKASPLPLCGQCKMKHCHDPALGKGVIGKGRKGIMIVLSHPEICEDNTGNIWDYDNTQSGTLLGSIIQSFRASGVDLERDCFRVNAVACCPRSNGREHLSDSANLCRPNLMKHIRELKPKVIIALGSASIEGLYGDRCASDITKQIATWHGFAIPDSELGAWVLPCYDSATLSEHYVSKDSGYVQKDTAKLVLKEITRVGVKALKLSKKGSPKDYLKWATSKCIADRDPKGAVAFLDSIEKGDIISFDFETSAIKPDADCNFIKCVSVYSRKIDESHGFMLDTRKLSSDLYKSFKRVMRDKDIKKVGQNLKMEERWTRSKLNYRVKGWVWDTMLSSHFLYSSKQKATGLKFQTGVNFGVFNYNERVDRYLKESTGNFKCGDNTTNGIDKISDTDLLTYCAFDSLFTYELFLKQKKMIGKWKMQLEDAIPYKEGNRFLFDSIMTFCNMEEVGTYIDVDYLKRQKKECQTQIDALINSFKMTHTWKLWVEEFGVKANPFSSKQLGTILYGRMGLKQKKKTTKGSDSTDKEAVLSLGIPDLVFLSDAKLLEKARGTDINQILREVVGNIVRTSFNLNITATFRSSSNSPNLQNKPIRNKRIGLIIRGAFVSRFGKKGIIIEADLKGAEVSASACYHKDSKFMAYISDSKNDMHKDTMGLIVNAPPPQITKDLRHIAKNKFVFPEFYGDWYKSCTEAIWQEMQKLKLVDGKSVMQHLHDTKVLCLPKKWKEGDYMIQEHFPAPYAQFEEHMKNVEHTFWYEMFPEYTEWKDFWYKKYLRMGYVESLTGFRYTGILDRKQTTNYPIQGTAYHLNQRGANIVDMRLRKEKFDTRLFNQIHDSQLFDSHVDEYKEVIAMHNRVMNVNLREEYTWINVPIVVEFEVTEPGASWFHKKPFELIA